MDMIVKTIKKAEHWRIDAFELWCWRRLFFFLLLNFNFYFILLYNTVSLLDCKEIQPVHHKGNQSWIFTGRTDAEAEAPILWPPDVKNWLIWKDPDAGTDWRWERKGMTEDKMVGWQYRLNGHEFEWVSSGSWWWTGWPGMLQFMVSQRVRHN